MSDNEKKFTPHQQKEIDKINKEADIRKKAEEDLMANQAIQEYLAKFTPSSVTDFINHYLSNKTIWHLNGETYLKQKEHHDMEWIEAANDHLKNIQQKKLFDLQCLWRAEKIQLPGVDICFDFQIWEGDILNCPFVDPITADEVELYKEYLLQENVDLENELYGSFISWQSYTELKDAYETGNDRHCFPEWYDFHNGRRGTGVYMSLPDIRGKKEQQYMGLGLAQSPEREKAIRAMQDVIQNPDKPRKDKEGLLYLNRYDTTITDYFVSTFEDKVTKKYYKAYNWFFRNQTDEDDIMEIVDMFIESGETISIEAHANWKEALMKAGKKFRARKIVEAMDDAFDQYQLTLSMNIGFANRDRIFSLEDVKKTLIKDILKGRKELGEPEDLNF